MKLKQHAALLLCALLIMAGWQPGVSQAEPLEPVITLATIPDQYRGNTVTLQGTTTLDEINVKVVGSHGRLVFIDTFAPKEDGSYSQVFTISANEALGTVTVVAGEGAVTATRTFRIILPGNSDPGNPTPSTPPVTPVTPETPEPTPETPEPADTGVEVIVGGKAEPGAAPRMTNQGGRRTATVALDARQLDDLLSSAGQRPTVTLAVKTEADAVVGELTGRMVSSMEQRQAVIVIRTGGADYTLPAEQINIQAVSQQLGETVALEDIVVRIEIAKPAPAVATRVENAATTGGFVLVAPPLEFNVTAIHGSHTVHVSRFNSYVERSIKLPAGIDPDKVTTGVVIEPDGTVRHVPTQVSVIAGSYYAKINSLTNSTYSVIWNPVTFEDVERHWSREAVDDMGSRLIVSGVGEGSFLPDLDITRAEFAAILVRGLGLGPESVSSAFADVSSSAWYSVVVATAADYGLIHGFEDGTFRPQVKITREQAMTMLARAMQLTGLKAQLPASSASEQLAAYADGNRVSSWAAAAVADALQAGIV
ncbi:S-layer homology domain-containing protein, partial [Paenibacillus sp. 598K]|uniref:S-layer homology domain-containing protein n=1 Tax=Paenibacillus sp. 598K TaxID=1117987 RepID=UPI00162885F2